MKKILLLTLVICLAFALASCKPTAQCEHADENYDGLCDKGCGTTLEVDVMTYDEYVAAELSDFVVVDAYVQATQSWWDDKITVYLADEDGAYFAYEMACSEEDAAKLTAGTKIRVYGYKDAWAGEVEITDCAFNFLEADPYIAPAVEINSVLGTDDLINYQNQLAIFRGLEVVSVEYKNGEPGDDIYLTVKHGETEYSFCVERYLTAPDTEVYTAVGELEAGDIIDIEAFVYWYEGPNPHVVSVSKYMTQAEYDAAELQSEVKLLSYVQAKQSWWDNKGTFYLQSEDGAVFAYEMAVTEEEYNKLTVGTKVAVVGFKGEWSGEIEVIDGSIHYVGGDTYVATATDLTDKIASDDLIDYQNQLVQFTDMTIVSIEYKNGEPGDDIYLTLSKDGVINYSFCVEIYLTGAKTELYELISHGLVEPGDVVDVECFLYWYNGMNPHVVAIKNINE